MIEAPFSKRRMGFVIWGTLDFEHIIVIKNKGGIMMENMKKMAVALIIVGLASLVVGVIGKIIGSAIAGFSPRGFGEFTMICFLLSINLLLLDKKS